MLKDRKWAHPRLWGTAAAFAMVSGTALGQSASDIQADTGSALQLDEVSVTAIRSPISVMRYPGMVSVIDREEIDRKDPHTLEDLLRRVPGVFFNGGARRTGQVPTIRGFDGENVQIRVDGARQNFVSGHDGRVMLDPALLGGVEVLRGGASSLYGSGALGGVLSFRTVSADDLLEDGARSAARAKFAYQDVSREFTESLTLATRAGGDIGLVGSVVKRDSGNIELSDGSKLTSDDDILTGLVKADIPVSESFDLSLSYLRFRNDATEPDNGQNANTAANSTIVDKEIGNDTVRATFAFAPEGSNLLDLEGTVYFANSGVRETDPATARVTDRDVDTTGFFLDNRSRLMLGDQVNLVLTYGAEGTFDRQDGSDSGAANNARAGTPDAEAEVTGVFLQGDVELSSALPGTLRLIPSIRYDSFTTNSSISTENSADEIAPKLGVSYEAVPGLVTFASYGKAFRAPSFNELYNDGTHFSTPIAGQTAVNSFVPNPDLKPEVAKTLEFGAGYSVNNLFFQGDALRLKGSHYRSDVENLIDIQVNFAFSAGCFNPLAGACNAGTTDTVNVPQAELRGYELEAAYDTGRYFAILGYSEVDGKNTRTGAKLGILVPERITTDIGMRLAEFDTVVGFESEIVNHFKKVNAINDQRPGYALFDVYLQWAPQSALLRGFTLNLGVDNLFDKKHERVAANVPEPGRNVKASLAYQLNF